MKRNLDSERMALIWSLVAKLEEEGILELLISEQFKGPEKYEKIKRHLFALVRAEKLPDINEFKKMLGVKEPKTSIFDY